MLEGLPAAAATPPWQVSGSASRTGQRIALLEFPDLPGLLQLPDRGPGADLIGRTAARLGEVSGDLSVETTPTGWRLTAAPGRDHRRAASLLDEDLDALEEHAQGYSGPLVVGVAGPWSLAARIERPNGERVVTDPGLTRDFGAALAEAAANLVAQVRRRLPGVEPLLRIDEPELAAVLDGALPSRSGLGRSRAVPLADAESALATVASRAGAQAGVRGDGATAAVAKRAGLVLRWLRLDATSGDDLAEWLDSGGRVVLEVDAQARIPAIVRRLGRLASDVGLDLPRLAAVTALSAASADVAELAALGRHLSELGRAVRDEFER